MQRFLRDNVLRVLFQQTRQNLANMPFKSDQRKSVDILPGNSQFNKFKEKIHQNWTENKDFLCLSNMRNFVI